MPLESGRGFFSGMLCYDMPLTAVHRVLGAGGGVAVTALGQLAFDGRVFPVALIGMSLTLLAMLAVWLTVPSAPGVSSKKSEKSGRSETSTVLPILGRRILTTCVLGTAFDSFGDYGNRFGRNTIMTNRFATVGARDPNNQNIFLLLLFVAAMCGVQLVQRGWRKRGLPFFACFGNVMSAVCQMGLLLIGRPSLMPSDTSAMWGSYSHAHSPFMRMHPSCTCTPQALCGRSTRSFGSHRASDSRLRWLLT